MSGGQWAWFWVAVVVIMITVTAVFGDPSPDGPQPRTWEPANDPNPNCVYNRHYCENLPRITEDDPRWNCETMGNRVCGR